MDPLPFPQSVSRVQDPQHPKFQYPVGEGAGKRVSTTCNHKDGSGDGKPLARAGSQKGTHHHQRGCLGEMRLKTA